MKTILGLGSNLGDRSKYLDVAKFLIKHLGDTSIIEKSTILETKPYGFTDQDNFLNQVIEIETQYSPQELLKKINNIEKQLGRKRTRRWGPRTIDIDILFYGDQIIEEPNLKIPHIGIPERQFILNSLMEKWKNLIHPKLNLTIEQLYNKLKDEKK